VNCVLVSHLLIHHSFRARRRRSASNICARCYAYQSKPNVLLKSVENDPVSVQLWLPVKLVLLRIPECVLSIAVPRFVDDSGWLLG